jgi:hypothetical protein
VQGSDGGTRFIDPIFFGLFHSKIKLTNDVPEGISASGKEIT